MPINETNMPTPEQDNQNETPVLETITVTLSLSEQRAIRKMALKDGNVSNTDYAQKVINSALKSKLKSMFLSDQAKATLLKSYDKAALVAGGPDKLPITREDFLKNQLSDAQGIYNEMGQ